MCFKILRLFHFLIAIDVTFSKKKASEYKCHALTNVIPQDIAEGPLGETNLFPWLGVIKVFIRDEGDIYVALSGTVFITDRHVLANSGEVDKIPEWIFRKDVKAMFIPFNGVPLHFKLVDIVTHPEYMDPTVNTISLVTVRPDKGYSMPMLPVCWPSKLYQNADNLYIVGFTDERGILEKCLYKAKISEIEQCDRFYEEEELNIGNRRPVKYMCASTTNVNRSCVWETGNALVSNSTGFWVLVGFGVNGPGCAMPGRFLDVLEYLPWIWSRARPELERTKRYRGLRRYNFNVLNDFNYTFDTEQYHYLYFKMNRTSPTGTIIHINQISDTSKCGKLIYREIADVTGIGKNYKGNTKSATYKLSLYDLHYFNISCVSIQLDAEHDKNAYLFVENYLDDTEGAALYEWGDTPEDLLQTYLLVNGSAIKPTDKAEHWAPGPKLSVHTLKNAAQRTMIKNHNLFFKFTFQGAASYHIEVYAKLTDDNIRPAPLLKNLTLIRAVRYSLLHPKKYEHRKFAINDYALQIATASAPLNKVSLYEAALAAAVYHATLLSVYALVTCNADAQGYSSEKLEESYYDKSNILLRDIAENKYLRHAMREAILKAKRERHDTSESVTLTGFGNASAYIPDPYYSQRQFKATTRSEGETRSRVRMYDKYSTVDTEVTMRAFSNHSTLFGNFITIPSKRNHHRWCIFPHNFTVPHKCYNENEYNDDNLPPEYQSL